MLFKFYHPFFNAFTYVLAKSHPFGTLKEGLIKINTKRTPQLRNALLLPLRSYKSYTIIKHFISLFVKIQLNITITEK
jgi:hypothetical protein